MFCTRKFGHELIAKRDELNAPAAVVRIEQLYPWPEDEIAEQLDTLPDAEVMWAQEEPGNMGARYFARRRIEELATGRCPSRGAAASPSPATGSSTVHDAEQQNSSKKPVSSKRSNRSKRPSSRSSRGEPADSASTSASSMAHTAPRWPVEDRADEHAVIASMSARSRAPATPARTATRPRVAIGTNRRWRRELGERRRLGDHHGITRPWVVC